MKGTKYIFDAAAGVFRKSAMTVSSFLLRAVKYLAAATALAAVWYVVFALVLSTDEEKRLKAENKVYEDTYDGMKDDINLLTAVVTGLEYRDDAIHRDVFKSGVPSGSALGSGEDEAPSDADVADFTKKRLASALDGAARVDSTFQRIFTDILCDSCVVPPICAPVDNFSVARAGASVGVKTSPFLKMDIQHNGLDIVAPSGSLVVAAAAGTVQGVNRSAKGEGNVVTISHAGGYTTRYAHLGSIAVKAGAKVSRGTVIGTVGLSGMSYAPHLHYEVLKGTQVCDPVDHMFMSVTPAAYEDLKRMTSGAGQSLD